MFQDIVLFGKEIDLYDPITRLGQLCIILWIAFNLKEYKAISTFSNIPEAKRGAEKSNFFFKWLIPFFGIFFVFLFLFALNAPITPMISKLFLGDKSDNFFYNILILPIGLFLAGTLLKMSPLKFMDYIAPAISLALIFFKLACACCGCCYGVPSEKFGIMNHYNERMEFPVQLVELGCAVIMFVIILLVRRKKDKTPGILYPMFMLMYCGSRFVSEFWRGDYPEVWGPLKGYHIQCIIGFVEGLIFLFVALKWGRRITERFQTKRQTILERFQNNKKGKSKKGGSSKKKK